MRSRTSADPSPGRVRALIFIEVLTVGLPFSAFKVICGWQWLSGAVVPGGLLLGLGAVDAVLNTLNAATVVASGRRRVPVCCLNAGVLALRPMGNGDVGTAGCSARGSCAWPRPWRHATRCRKRAGATVQRTIKLASCPRSLSLERARWQYSGGRTGWRQGGEQRHDPETEANDGIARGIGSLDAIEKRRE